MDTQNQALRGRKVYDYIIKQNGSLIILEILATIILSLYVISKLVDFIR